MSGKQVCDEIIKKKQKKKELKIKSRDIFPNFDWFPFALDIFSNFVLCKYYIK